MKLLKQHMLPVHAHSAAFWLPSFFGCPAAFFTHTLVCVNSGGGAGEKLNCSKHVLTDNEIAETIHVLTGKFTRALHSTIDLQHISARHCSATKIASTCHSKRRANFHAKKRHVAHNLRMEFCKINCSDMLFVTHSSMALTKKCTR